MRILLVILHAQSARGGAERYTRDLAAALLSRGLAVATAALDFDADWPGEHRRLAAGGITRASEYADFLDALDTLLLTDRFDAVHAMLPVRHCTVYHPHAGVAAARKRQGAVGLVIDQLNRRRQAMAKTEFDLLTSAKPPLTLALSNYILTAFREIYPKAPAEVLLNGVDLARFDPALHVHERAPQRQKWGVAPGDVVALMVAQDFARKGVPVAVEALAHLQDPSLKLVVVGKDDPAPILKQAASLGISGQVLLPGPTSDPRPAYAAADLFLLPTHHDPCSLVVIEALAMGLPTLSTTFNGSSEYITPGLHGQVLPRVDSNLLAAALQPYLDPATRAQARAACLALRPALSYDAHYARLATLYQALAG